MEIWMIIIIGIAIIIGILVLIKIMTSGSSNEDSLDFEINVFKKGFNACCKKLSGGSGI